MYYYGRTGIVKQKAGMGRHGCIDEGFIQRTTHAQLHFLGQQILFLLFLRRLLLFLGGAVFWEEEDGQRLMRYMVLFCIGRAYTLGVDVSFFGAQVFYISS